MEPEPATPTSIPSPGGIRLPSPLEEFKIPSVPNLGFYVADFISSSEEAFLLDKIASAPKPRWRQLSHRRLQTWPSDLVRDALVDAPLPPWLDSPVVSRLLSIPRSDGEPNIFASSPHSKPNHVLINEYAPGSGIKPHKDGAAYYPIVATVSLGSSICLNLYKSKDDGALDPKPAYRILQEPRSLLITTEDLYHDFLHGIEEVEEDAQLGDTTVANWTLLRDPSAFSEGRNVRKLRYSLTYRDVLKISKLSRLGAFAKR